MKMWIFFLANKELCRRQASYREAISVEQNYLFLLAVNPDTNLEQCRNFWTEFGFEQSYIPSIPNPLEVIIPVQYQNRLEVS